MFEDPILHYFLPSQFGLLVQVVPLQFMVPFLQRPVVVHKTEYESPLMPPLAGLILVELSTECTPPQLSGGAGEVGEVVPVEMRQILLINTRHIIWMEIKQDQDRITFLILLIRRLTNQRP